MPGSTVKASPNEDVLLQAKAILADPNLYLELSRDGNSELPRGPFVRAWAGLTQGDRDLWLMAHEVPGWENELPPGPRLKESAKRVTLALWETIWVKYSFYGLDPRLRDKLRRFDALSADELLAQPTLLRERYWKNQELETLLDWANEAGETELAELIGTTLHHHAA